MGATQGRAQATRMKKKKSKSKSSKKTAKARKKYSKPALVKHGVLSIVEGD